jgi:hypothetical protein
MLSLNILFKAKCTLWLFGHFKVPMIAYVRPKILEISEDKLIIKIKLRRRTKNHLSSMYFGTLAVGADVAGGLLAIFYANKSKQKISLAFKSFKAEFLKRPESDVYFICEEGARIKDMVNRSKIEKVRINEMLSIEGFTDYYGTKEKVADFGLELSVKVK